MSGKSNKCVYMFPILLIDGATIENNKCVQTGNFKGVRKFAKKLT